MKLSSNKEVESRIQPRSKSGFFARLSTFSMAAWPAKPEGASPMKCAQYGWENTEVEVLKCVTCKKLLISNLPVSRDLETYKDAMSKLCDSIVSAHHKFCPWRENSSPESFFNICNWDAEEILCNLKKRLESLSRILDRLPVAIESSIIDMFSILTKLSCVLKEDNIKVTEESIHLALAGWQRKNETSLLILECEYCMREVGLWIFDGSPTKNGTNGLETNNVEPSAKRIKLDDNTFNAISQHKLWCPWLAKVKDSKGDVIPCWLSHLHHLLKMDFGCIDGGTSSDNSEFDLQKKLRVVRKIISNCTSATPSN